MAWKVIASFRWSDQEDRADCFHDAKRITLQARADHPDRKFRFIVIPPNKIHVQERLDS